MKTTLAPRAVAALAILTVAMAAATLPVAATLPTAASMAQCQGRWRLRVIAQPHQFEVLSGVSAAATTDAWAVGSFVDENRTDVQPLMEHWDGAMWTEMDGPHLQRGGQLVGVAAVSSTNVWAAGGRSTTPPRTLIEHWDGSRWSTVKSPSPDIGSGLQGMAASSATDVWAVGSRSIPGATRTLTEHWDGASWKVVKSANVDGVEQNLLLGVTAASPDDVWAVGWIVTNAGVARTLAEHWNGRRWRVVSTQNASLGGNFLRSVSAASSDDVWAVGDYIDADGHDRSLIQHWDGKSWTIVNGRNPGAGNALYAVSASPGGEVWAVGAWGESTGPSQVFTERWDNGAWTQYEGVNPGASSNQLFAVTAESNRVLAVGAYSNADAWMHALAEDLCLR